ncbi:hypothetical protein [Candidatus Burkholderia verschuerenii]|uniref:hypothetical protein n=1 Tax=Candidatus Burkholderia verschuerenii TaxID=242163 RepID=UPI001E5F86BD|nr:hypothetical protein [Candidatus Burkholderia verschuerenii]
MTRVVAILLIEAHREIGRLFAPQLGVFAHEPVVDAFSLETGDRHIEINEQQQGRHPEQREKRRREPEARRAM